MGLIRFATLSLVGAFVIAGLPAASIAQEKPALLPLASFFQHPGFTDAAMSPNGRLVAAKMIHKDGPVMLVVIPVDTLVPRVVMRSASDVAQFRWANDSRLVFTLTDRDVALDEITRGPGLFAINIDGSDPRQLADRRRTGVRSNSSDKFLPMQTTMISAVGKQDSDFIFVNTLEYEKPAGTIVNLVQLNTKTGRAVKVPRPGHTVSWLLDESSEPRIAITAEGKNMAVHYRDPASKEWRKLQEFDLRSPDVIAPLGFGPDGSLYTLARKGEDKLALYLYDLKKNALADQPIIRLKDHDFQGSLIYQRDQLVGLRYLAQSVATLWFDDDMKKLQADIDNKLPSTNNSLSLGRRSETPFVLVHAASDKEPGATYLLNTETGKMNLLGRVHPQIDPASMASMEAMRYKARDGMEIPAYLTLPQGAARKNLPLIVLVHGGPWVRGGYWRWSPDAQFLASRGYAVLEPDFRGSTGYGYRHFAASFKQWGLAMQDDLADGAKWAIEQGIADPKRICIAGASYGGYAALMGVLKDPQLFRCAINWVGVTDINLLYDAHWSDVTDVTTTWSLPVLVGDQKTDEALIKAASPLVNAAKIKQPLLLAYGTEDRRVPLVHGTRFRNAVSVNNPDVEWVEYNGEGHGWRLVKTRLDFWGRVERFLDKHIGVKAAGQ